MTLNNNHSIDVQLCARLECGVWQDMCQGPGALDMMVWPTCSSRTRGVTLPGRSQNCGVSSGANSCMYTAGSAPLRSSMSCAKIWKTYG